MVQSGKDMKKFLKTYTFPIIIAQKTTWVP